MVIWCGSYYNYFDNYYTVFAFYLANDFEVDNDDDDYDDDEQ